MSYIYRSDRAAVWHGDARDMLPGIARESFHLVIADPPYGVEWVSGQRAERFEGMANDDAAGTGVVLEVLQHCVRLTAQNRHLYVFGPEVLAAAGAKVSAPAQLVWDKTAMTAGDLSAPFGAQHELINFYVGLERHGGQRGKDTLPARLRKGSVLRFARPTGRSVRHPSEKPVALLTELVESSSRVGELVLDPFGGVGSTGVAAVLSGRRALVCEIEERYAAVAAQRIALAEEIRGRAEGI